MNVGDKELIWVSKDVAERYNKLTSDKTRIEEQNKIIDEYMEGISTKLKEEYKTNLSVLEEDAAIFTGLNFKVKQSFDAALKSCIDANYLIWDKFEEERPNISKKISDIIGMLKPLREELDQINKLLGGISTYHFDKLTESLSAVSNLHGNNKDMFEFLIKNYKPAT